jgi:hypothetical protein
MVSLSAVVEGIFAKFVRFALFGVVGLPDEQPAIINILKAIDK